MSTVFITPNMSLPNPVVGSEPGPQWASDLYNCLTILDAHDHSPGSGVPITPSGLNINADLTFNNTNNIISIRSVRFKAQTVPIPASGSDLGCIYESGVDLYYNDGSGNQVRITQSGSVAGSAGTITGLPSGTASAAFSSGSGTFIFLQATSTGANLDVASIAIRYPGSYPTPAGNYIQLQAPTSLSSGYSLTLPSLPAANNTFLSVSTAGIIGSSLVLDNSTIYLSGSNIAIKPQGVTQGLLALRPSSSSASAGGIAIATGSSYTNSSSTFTTVAAVTLTTTGRPVAVQLQGTNASAQSFISLLATPSDQQVKAVFHLTVSSGFIEFPVALAVSGGSSLCELIIPPGAISYLDIASASTYTYTLTAKIDTAFASGTLSVQNYQLIAYEI